MRMMMERMTQQDAALADKTCSHSRLLQHSSTQIGPTWRGSERRWTTSQAI
jgi:hypothetical protein